MNIYGDVGHARCRFGAVLSVCMSVHVCFYVDESLSLYRGDRRRPAGAAARARGRGAGPGRALELLVALSPAQSFSLTHVSHGCVW